MSGVLQTGLGAFRLLVLLPGDVLRLALLGAIASMRAARPSLSFKFPFLELHLLVELRVVELSRMSPLHNVLAELKQHFLPCRGAQLARELGLRPTEHLDAAGEIRRGVRL